MYSLKLIQLYACVYEAVVGRVVIAMTTKKLLSNQITENFHLLRDGFKCFLKSLMAGKRTQATLIMLSCLVDFDIHQVHFFYKNQVIFVEARCSYSKMTKISNFAHTLFLFYAFKMLFRMSSFISNNSTIRTRFLFCKKVVYKKVGLQRPKK